MSSRQHSSHPLLHILNSVGIQFYEHLIVYDPYFASSDKIMNFSVNTILRQFSVGADLAPLVREFILEKNTLIRGLAHPAVFAAGAQGGGGGQMSQFQKFGAVKVSPGSILEVTAILLCFKIFSSCRQFASPL
jgi:hypothetical protein